MGEALDDFDGLLRWGPLQAWVRDEHLPGEGPVLEVRQISGGSQNNIFVLRRRGGSFVLRRPPRHPRLESDDVILREARVMRALDGTGVPHARLFAVCADRELIGACFSTMEVVNGFTPRGQLPGKYAGDVSWRRALAFEIVDGAARLASVDPVAVGLGDLGRHESWLERQVERWRSQLDGYQQLDGYRGRTLGRVDDIGSWLTKQRPNATVAGLIHGDLQFANVLFAHDRPEMLAMIDWELSTLGDPLLDLGWILTSWCEADDPPGHDPYVVPFDGLPTRAELVERYVTITGRDPALVRWFFVLACYKLAILVEGTYARALSGRAPMEVGLRLHRNARWFLSKAIQVLE